MATAPQNRFFQALYNHCAAKPLAVEDHPWGETVFKIGGKVFAFLGLPDQAGVAVKAAPDEVDGLLLLSFIQRSPYIGRFGWVRVNVANEDALDVALRLIDQSYELIGAKAPRKKRATDKSKSGPFAKPKASKIPKKRPKRG
jgi:predicted DNA-binding protein (MmcQ/YjbR family)